MLRNPAIARLLPDILFARKVEEDLEKDAMALLVRESPAAERARRLQLLQGKAPAGKKGGKTADEALRGCLDTCDVGGVVERFHAVRRTCVETKFRVPHAIDATCFRSCV